ncbi:MAG: S8 family serine peptidase, partial [Candidatus Thorarchaeota archaeon]
MGVLIVGIVGTGNDMEVSSQAEIESRSSSRLTIIIKRAIYTLLKNSLLGVWVSVSLILVDIAIGIISTFSFLFYGLHEISWHIPNYISHTLVPLNISIVILYALIIEVSVNALKGERRFGGHTLILCKSFLLSILSVTFLGEFLNVLFPIYSRILLFLFIILFYKTSFWLSLPDRKKRATVLKNQIFGEIKKPKFNFITSVSPASITGTLVIFGIWNWTALQYISTYSLVSAAFLYLPMIVICGITTSLAALLVVRSIKNEDLSQYSSLIQFSLYSLCIFEVVRLYALDILSFLFLICATLVSYPLATRLTLKIRSREKGASGVTTGWLSGCRALIKYHRYNAMIILLSGLILGSVFIVPREAVAFYHPQASGVKVGIIDTGVLTDDPYLRKSVAQERSFVTVENGFSHNEISAQPLGSAISHGTLVAHCLKDVYFNASIVNAKVANSSGYITKDAILEAFHWCVEEAEVSVIS